MRLQWWVGVCLIASLSVGAWAQEEAWRRRKAEPVTPSELPKEPEPMKPIEPIAPLIETVTYDLPPKLRLPSLPAKPLDDRLRVALILPSDEPAGRSQISGKDILEKKNVRQAFVNHAHPVATVLPTVIAKLFPRIGIVEKAPEPGNWDTCDLVLQMRVRATGVQNSQGVYQEVRVYGTLIASHPNGSQITAIEAMGQGTIKKRIYWSLASGVKTAGVPAIQQMLDNLVEAPEQRVVVHVPRTTGRDAPMQTLSLAVTAAQRDFEARETRIELAFAAHRPQLSLALAEASPLLEGGSASLSLDVRNQGLLDAEHVQLEVTSANAAVDLLDERGAPVSKRLLDVGTIAARASLTPIELKVHVKRKTAPGQASLKVVARQQDFPAVTREEVLRIEPEAPKEIIVNPPPPRPQRRDRATPVPASVAFRRYEEGERVAGETIALRFEVQSGSRVERVRLEHNGRVITLDPPRLLPGQGGRLLEYEQQIDLDYGANLFEVVVVTEEGLRSSRTLTLHRDRPDGRIWLAVVGISDYAGDAVNDLAFARKDAVAIAAYYSERFGIDDGQIIQLLDEKATLANIKRSLGTELVAKALNPNDTVIIYFAGHGLKERDRASADADGFTK
jgi:hypothetical protein